MTNGVFKYLGPDGLMRPMMPIMGWYMRVSPNMITCREFNDFIYDYIEGALTDKQVDLFKRHMRVCPSCRKFLKNYIAAYKAESQIFPYEDVEVPNTVPEDLIDAILDIKQSRTEQ